MIATKHIVSSSGRALRRLREEESGNALIELAMLTPVLVLLSVGLVESGLNLDRYLNMEHVVRSAANMYSRGIDFTQGSMQNKLLRGAADIPITRHSGEGVVYLSRVIVAEGGANAGLPVVQERITIGNPSTAESKLGTPAVADDGHVIDFENSGAALATLPAVVNMRGTQELFVAEFFHNPSGLKLLGLATPDLMYRVAFF